MEVEASDTIDKVKDKIQDKTRIPPDQQHLIFNGVSIDHIVSIEFAGIRKGDTIRLVGQLLGAGKKAENRFGIVVFPLAKDMSRLPP